MVQGDGDRLTQEYFRLIETILDSRGLSARSVSRKIGKSHPYFSRLKSRKQLGRSWKIVEDGLGLSPRTLLAVLSKDVELHQILAAFGPQDEPHRLEFIDRLGGLLPVIEELGPRRRDRVGAGTFQALEDLECRRFTMRAEVETECRLAVLKIIEQDSEMQVDDVAMAVGALGIWSTARRHGNDVGSATRGLVLALQAASALGDQRLLARQLQRATYLLCDVERFDLAESMAEKAAKLYSDVADLQGLGMALIDTGMAAYGGRDLERAQARLLLGAGFLGSSPFNHINKASAYHLAAKCCAIQGNLGTAISHLEEAAKFAGSYKKEWAAIRWCAGNVLLQMGKLKPAESALQEALQIYVAEDRVTDIVMLLLDLAMVLVAQKRVDEVPRLARYLRPYLGRTTEKVQIRSHVEEAYTCLLRAHHRQALERFRVAYERAWRGEHATP